MKAGDRVKLGHQDLLGTVVYASDDRDPAWCTVLWDDGVPTGGLQALLVVVE